MTKYLGLQISKSDQPALKAFFQPQYLDVKCDHITFALCESFNEASKLLPHQLVVEIDGYINDGRGMDILTVRINGERCRPWWGYYHITHSLDKSIMAPVAYDIFSKETEKKSFPYSGRVANGILASIFDDQGQLKPQTPEGSTVHMLERPIRIDVQPYFSDGHRRHSL